MPQRMSKLKLEEERQTDQNDGVGLKIVSSINVIFEI